MCGIAGYIGNNFNKYKFNTLGLYNDSRGGDSCGIFINNDGVNSVYYGHDKTKLYKNFVELGGLKDVNLESPNFALLHCRKASVGGISLATAQPVVIRNAQNEVVFAMIHNGTLVNYKDLANKYSVEFELTETDSQIFCKTVYAAGYGVLAEYDGAGAFVFWDSRDGDDTIKIFKGASQFYEDDNNLYIERPLYCMSQEDSFWFSSMEESLNFINDENVKVENVAHNKLITIKNGNIISEIPIDRSKRKQSEKLAINWEKQKRENSGRHIPSYRYGDYYGDWPDSWDEEYTPNQSYQYIKTDKILNPGYIPKDKIYLNWNCLYYYNGEPCDGEIESTPSGYTCQSSIAKQKYYFVMGVLMSSYFDYLCATQYVLQNFQMTEDECIEMYLAPYSPSPVPWIMEDSAANKFIELYEYDEISKDIKLFSGNFEPLFEYSATRYFVANGEITSYNKSNNKRSFYEVPIEKAIIDKQILSGEISKNYLKKMIRKELKNVYARS